MNGIFTPLARAVGQLDDWVFIGVLAQSLLLAAAAFFGLHLLAIAVVHWMLELHGFWAWIADILGSLAAWVLALWLFLPLAAIIASLFIEPVARAVERRWYPNLSPAAGASLMEQIRVGLAVGLRIALLNLLALLIALFLPGIGLVIGWAISAWGLGRGLFITVAMRRLDRQGSEAVYRAARWPIFVQGGAMALAGTVPLLNLMIPVVGTATMVHVLDQTVESMRPAA